MVPDGSECESSPAHVSIVPAPHTHELTLLAVDYWMAARFFEVLKPLKSHYIDSLKGTGNFRREDVVLRIHIDDQGPNLPDLFPRGWGQTEAEGA